MEASSRFSVTDLWSPNDSLPGHVILVAIAERLGGAWDVEDLTRHVKIRYNPRLRSTLGRAMLDDGCVELNTRLLREHPGELLDVLAHELAHVVVHLRYGQVPPHGVHFRTLMRAVNLSHKATHSLPVKHLRRPRRKYLYLHRCSDCGYSFIGRRIHRNYYCVACGPEMTWSIVARPNTKQGRLSLKEPW